MKSQNLVAREAGLRFVSNSEFDTVGNSHQDQYKWYRIGNFVAQVLQKCPDRLLEQVSLIIVHLPRWSELVTDAINLITAFARAWAHRGRPSPMPKQETYRK